MGNPWTPEEKRYLQQQMMCNLRNGIPIMRSYQLIACDLKRTAYGVESCWRNHFLAHYEDEINRLLGRKKIIDEPKEYIALDDLDFNFEWTHEEVERFDIWYKEGLSIKEMAERFEREHDEVLVLLIDRANKNKLSKRKKSMPMYKQRMLQHV